MCSRRSSRRRLFLAAALLLPTPLFGQTTSTWLAPVSGTWFDGTNWSTGTYPSPTTQALIAATGTPYTIFTSNGTINPARIDLASPDATLDITSYTADTTLNLAAGAAILHGTGLRYTTVTGSVSLAIDSANPRLTEITLATDLRGTGSITNNKTEFYGTLALDNGTVHLSPTLRPMFYNGVNITGTGTLVADSGLVSSYVDAKTTAYPNTLALGPGVTLKTAAGGSLSLDGFGTNPRIYNNGTISAEAPGTSISIGGSVFNGTTFLSVVNGGLLAASNGGTLSVALPAGGSTGKLSLATGGTIALKGSDYSFTQPVTIPAATTLRLDGGWKVTAPLTLDAGGTLTIASAPTVSANIQYNPGSTVRLINTISAPALPLLNTTPSTTLYLASRLDLGGSSLSLASIPGQWTYAPRLFLEIGGPTGDGFNAIIQSGTLSAGAVGNDLLPTGGALKLTSVTVDFPLALNHGTLFAQSTTFAQPVSVSDTGRLILSTFSNVAGITATGGTLELTSLPPSPGPITMSGESTLQLNFSTTLAQAAALPFGSPGIIAAGPRGVLDLESAAVDLSTSPFQLALAGAYNPATLRNGTITDTSHTHAIRVYPSIPGGNDGNYRNQFANLSCSADIIIDPLTTLHLFNTSLHDSHVSGGGTLTYGPASTPQTTTLDHVTLDGVPLHAYSNSPLTITNGLTTNAAITIDPGSTVDLTTATLLITYTSPSPADTVRQYLYDGRLTSSSADATHRLGYFDDGASVTVRFTLAGDANLDGVLDADDYALLDKGFALNASTWWLGDFNYDGQVDANDYLLIDTTYGQSQGFGPAFLSLRESQFGADYVSQLLTSIPEPSSLAYLVATLLAARRRK